MRVDLGLLAIVILLGGLIPLLMLYLRKAGTGPTKSSKKISSSKRLKMLKQTNPKAAKTPQALRVMADSQYEMQLWQDAADSYERLLEITKEKPEFFSVDIPTRLGLSALHAKQYDRATRALLIARSVKESSFEVNYALGKVRYLKKDYPAAVNYFRWALAQKSDHQGTQRLLGVSLARSSLFNEALTFLEQSLTHNSQDATVMFYYARSCQFIGNTQKALNYYDKLSANVRYGSYALLQVGLEMKQKKQNEEAAKMFEKALSYPKIPQSVYLELNYHLAEAYVLIGKYKKSTGPLRSIMALDPGYKDTMKKLELYENENLYVFLFGQDSEFSKLAMRVAHSLYPDDEVHAVRAAEKRVDDGKVYDLVVRVRRIGSSEFICLRYVRSGKTVKDNEIRELSEYMRDTDASQSVCFCASSYSDLAVDYAASRPIRLIDRTKLINFFATMK